MKDRLFTIELADKYFDKCTIKGVYNEPLCYFWRYKTDDENEVCLYNGDDEYWLLTIDGNGKGFRKGKLDDFDFRYVSELQMAFDLFGVKFKII